MTFSLKALHLQSFNLPAIKFFEKNMMFHKSVFQKKALNESVGANQLKTERKLLFSHKTYKTFGGHNVILSTVISSIDILSTVVIFKIKMLLMATI